MEVYDNLSSYFYIFNMFHGSFLKKKETNLKINEKWGAGTIGTRNYGVHMMYCPSWDLLGTQGVVVISITATGLRQP